MASPWRELGKTCPPVLLYITFEILTNPLKKRRKEYAKIKMFLPHHLKTAHEALEMGMPDEELPSPPDLSRSGDATVYA